MTSAAIEARSLSTLTTLASNPPRYPRNPTHERHEPLVLYIARVPGSRDVFLTPLKPREKVVTAEDVQSCLYYLHIDQPQDVQYLENPGEDPKPDSDLPPPPPVHRKAVGASAPHYSTSLPAPAPEGPPYHASIYPSHVTPHRKPVAPSPLISTPVNNNPYDPYSSSRPLPEAGDHYRGPSADLSSIRNNTEQPPILPPRRQSEQHPLPPRPPYPVENSIRNSPPRISQETLPAAFRDPFSSRPTSQSSYYGMTTPATHSRALRPSMSSEISFTSEDLGASLTLIRRDPSSSAQWNVARIEDPPILEISSSTIQSSGGPQKSKRSGAPIYLEINNLGYSKFLNTSEAISSVPAGGNGVSTGALKNIAANMSANNSIPPSETPNETVFKRRLWMEGARYNDKSFGHRRLNSHDSSTGSDIRSSLDGRNTERLSVDYKSSGAQYLARDDQAYAAVQMPDNRSSSFRGYAFTSPWNGRCEFSTGGAGRSLKCKHIMSGGLQGAASSTPIAATVSELRFNLPGTSLLSSTPRGDDGSSKRSSFFSRPRHGRHKSSNSDVGLGSTGGLADDLDKLDLSLGQEQAGGGFGGKQAKLGKLIIEDEGLKMIDLLVAANMSLYWRVYEKVDAKSRRANTSSEGY